MSIHPLPLAGKFVLVVMGERENGRFLLHTFVDKGAFLAIVCSPATYPTIAQIVRQDALLREHCFLFSAALTHEQLAQHTITEIAHIFGRIDIFIDYSTPLAKPGRLHPQTKSHNAPSIIPNIPLTTAVLGQMLSNG